MRTRAAEGLAVLVLGSLLCACGGPPAPLDGSLTQVCDVDYTRAELEVTADSLAVRFLRPRGTGEDLVLKVGVLTTGWTVRPKEQVNLAEPLPQGGQRGKVTRQVWEDPHESFPALQRGYVTLFEDPSGARRVRGELSLTFAQGHEFGAGRALFGEFDAEVKP